jgi:hypothetical protein
MVQAVERIASNISGDVCQLLCREETPDVSFKEKLLTTSLIGSRKVHSEHMEETYHLSCAEIALRMNCLNNSTMLTFTLQLFSLVQQTWAFAKHTWIQSQTLAFVCLSVIL